MIQSQSVPLVTSPRPLSSQISFGLVRVCTFQYTLARIMVKILFSLVAENVYGTDCNQYLYYEGC